MKMSSTFLFFCFILVLIIAITNSSTAAKISSNKAAVKIVKKSTFEVRKEGRILDGVDAVDGSAPHQVALFKGEQFACGGSLISLQTVLTAAHCVYEYSNTPTKFFIRYGSLGLNNGTKVEITSISYHPQYSTLISDYDIAVLHLATPIVKGTNADVISLGSEIPANGSLVTITGFGWTSTEGPPAEHLQMTDQMEVMSQEECDGFSYPPGGVAITDRLICLRVVNQTALPGDSGGPMVYGGKLVGVTSFLAVNLNDFSLMNGYTNVINLRGWIEANMNNGVGKGDLFSTKIINFALVFVSVFAGKRYL